MNTKAEVMMVTVAVAAACTVLVPGARAQCGSESSQPAIGWPGAKIFQSQKVVKPAANTQRREGDDPAPPGASIVGLWEMQNTRDGVVLVRGIDVWHSDGTETLNDINNPAGGNVCLGVWVKTGPDTYKLKHPFWRWDSTGTLIGSAVLRFEITVDPDGNSYTGTFTNDWFDLAGNNVRHRSGETSGQRITVD